MKKFLLAVLAAVSSGTAVQADLISPSQALARLAEVSAPGLPTRGSAEHDLLFTSRLSSGEAAVYVFGNGNSPGYLVLSADDAAAPLLGYADSGTFDEADMAPQMKWWIEEYGRQIEYARQNGSPAYRESASADRKAIAPLIKTRWDQSKPFNNMCPEIKGRHALTGCVATAMAQIMKYWNYPEAGTGRVSVTLPGTGTKDEMSIAAQSFDWGQMIDWYGSGSDYTEAQADAVAYLMKACGYSVDMNYSLSSSGALSMKAATALINNFKYNPNLQYYSRDYFTAEEWGDMVYAELEAKRPVLYSGVSPSGGHEFVCDGYSYNGYFHFNWGWSGLSDGYFLLNALDPSNLGNGGGTGGGFDYAQDIVTGIQPEATTEPTPRLTQLGNLRIAAQFTAITLTLQYGDRTGYWVNMGLLPADVTLGVVYEPIDGTPGETSYAEISTSLIGTPEFIRTESGNYNVSYKGFPGSQRAGIPSGLKDGKYKVTVCTKKKGAENSTYTPVLCGSEGYNYALLSKSGSSYSVTNLSVPEVTIKNAELISQLYYGAAVKMSITLHNESEKEITSTYFPMLCVNGEMAMTGDGLTITVAAGEIVTKEFSTIFQRLNGFDVPEYATQYQLGFYDPATDERYDWSSDVVMNVESEDPVLTISDFTMPGLDSKDVTTSDGAATKLFSVYNISAMPFSANMSVESGYWGWEVYLVITPNGGSEALSITKFDQLPTIGAGESATLTQTLDFQQGEEGQTYAAALYYIANNRYVMLGAAPIFFKVESNSGTGMTEADEAGIAVRLSKEAGTVTVSSAAGVASVAVVSLDGKTVVSLAAGGSDSADADVSGLAPGIYIVRATDATGRSRSVKIAL